MKNKSILRSKIL